MKELRIYGPPGTGKTTTLAKEYIPKAIEKYGDDKIVVTSYTRAAAREIASRDITVKKEHVGTLHSLCYHALGNPEIISNKHIKLWNENFGKYKISSIGKLSDIEEGEVFSGDCIGDALLSQTNILRAKGIPVNSWPKITDRDFINKFTEFKQSNNVLDYQDLIEKSIEEINYAPGYPRMMIVDEAQDLTQSQIKLIYKWGLDMEWLVLTGDDDQAIMSFMGADPKSFMLLNERKGVDKRVFNLSYRVPRVIHKAALDLISGVSMREKKEYNPKDFEGQIKRSNSTWEHPEQIISDAKKDMDCGLKVMFLSSCGYMLKPLKEQLKDAGVPFYNPYRKRKQDWNPLSSSTIEVINSFLSVGVDSPYWDVAHFVKWAKMLLVSETGLKKNTGNKALKFLEQQLNDHSVAKESYHTTRNLLDQVISQSAIQPALKRDLGWFVSNIKSTKKKAVEYPMKIIRNSGVESLRKEPGCIVGTIHSVKGGEADSVYIFPDISYKGMCEWNGSIEGRDNFLRLFYVGVTRASQKLTVAAPVVLKRGKYKTTMQVKIMQ